MDEQDEGLARLTDLFATWGVDLRAFLQGSSQETPAAGNGGDLRACLLERKHVAPVAGDAADGTAETMDSRKGVAVEDSSVAAGRAECDSDASAAFGTDEGDGKGPPAVMAVRSPLEVSIWYRLGPTVMGQIQGQSQRLQNEYLLNVIA